MKRYSLSHLTDGALLRDLAALVAQDRSTTAALLAHIAEVDARKLYLPAAYPNMHAYCVGELHLSEEAAFKRIRAARAARAFPALLEAIADGRLHLSAIVMLAPHLTADTVDELIAAATHRTKVQLEQLLVERFARPELAFHAPPLAPGPVGRDAMTTTCVEAAPVSLAPGPVNSDTREPERMSPEAPGARYALRTMIDQETRDMLAYFQALVGHQVPSGDVGEVIKCSLRHSIKAVERRKFAAASKPRAEHLGSTSARHIPAHVKRSVWARDDGQCTFVSETGHRCEARRCLEFDHAHELARGGEASVANIRLRCRAHNQYTAEQTYGAGFMVRKREQARVAAEETADRDVTPWLRALGFRADEARRAAEQCEPLVDATLEERVKLALSYLRPNRGVRQCPAAVP